MINDMFQFYQAMKKEDIIFCFSGPTSQSVVEGIGEALKQKMALETMTQTISRHIFSIFVEQMQNVVHYSAEKVNKDREIEDWLETEGSTTEGSTTEGYLETERGKTEGGKTEKGLETDGGQMEGGLRYGIIVIGRLESGEFYILSGNYIHKNDTKRVVALLDKLKGMDKNELKAFYKEQRRLERREGAKGAGLGMIETARKATRPIEYTLTGSNDGQHDFISIKAVI